MSSPPKSLRAVPVLAAALLASGHLCAQTITQTCPDLPNVRVEWNQTPFFGSFAYSVKSLRSASGSTSTSGWQLHHRPTSGWPFNFFDPETFVTGSSIIGYSIWDALIPVLPVPYFSPYTVTSLTCPEGECVLSPLTGCSRTYDPSLAGPKVALVGDSLVTLNELCVFGPPPAPDYCAAPLSQLLKNQGQRVWWFGAPGQGFFSYLDMIRERASTRPSKFIVAFGTNDALRQGRATPEQRDAERQNTARSLVAGIQAIRASNPAACVVLATVSGKPSDVASYPTEAAQVNTLLKNTAADPTLGGNVQVADFADAAQKQCPSDWLTNPSRTCDLFGSDQLHLTGKGNDVRNPLIMQAVGRCAP